MEIDPIFTETGSISLPRATEQYAVGATKRESKWFELPSLKPNTNPHSFNEIEFFRDLGPLQRINYDQKDQKLFKSLRRNYLSGMSEIDKMRQIFLLILFGMINIRKMEINKHMLDKSEMLELKAQVR